MKKYKVLKDLPSIKAGTIITANKTPYARSPGIIFCSERSMVDEEYAKKFPDFFEEVDERWKPEVDKEYFYISDYGDVDTYAFNSHSDRERYAFGNCFKTQEDAEKAAALVKETLLQFHADNK